jgi:hypothetical protein
MHHKNLLLLRSGGQTEDAHDCGHKGTPLVLKSTGTKPERRQRFSGRISSPEANTDSLLYYKNSFCTE